MTPHLSIDQNSNTLWDTVPKLDALSAAGLTCTHFLEDVDLAFTRHGVAPGDHHPELMPERYYRGGSSDWGATLFYAKFLGKLPFDVRALEPYTGWTTAALSRRLDLSVDDLYDRYSPSDNIQLVGASYIGDARHHRVIGDLTCREIAPFLREILRLARQDIKERFPEPDAARRIDAWFDAEDDLTTTLAERLLDAPLVDLYREWLLQRVGKGIRVSLTSRLFHHTPGTPAGDLLQRFAASYDSLAELYNRVVSETEVGVRPLNRADGELPFCAILRAHGHMVRTDLTLRDGRITAADHSWDLLPGNRPVPVERMLADGVICLPGKALLLVIQTRLKPEGGFLVLPYQGSLYMPAAYELQRRLVGEGFVRENPFPVKRVRFRFPDSWKGCRTLIRVPEHLHGAFPDIEYAAEDLAEAIGAAATEAAAALQRMTTGEGRDGMLRELFADDMGRRDALEARRRELARDPETRPQAGRIWDEVKDIDRRVLERQIDWILRSLRVLDLHYYDSRGALLPWSIALGGEAFYARLLRGARIAEEDPAELVTRPTPDMPS